MPDGATFGRCASEYTSRVTFWQNTPTTDSAGQRVANWGTAALFTRWAEVIPRGVSKKWVFEQLRPEVSHVVHVRYDSNTIAVFPTNFRIQLYDGTVLNIANRSDVGERHVELEFQCTEVQKNSY